MNDLVADFAAKETALSAALAARHRLDEAITGMKAARDKACEAVRCEASTFDAFYIVGDQTVVRASMKSVEVVSAVFVRKCDPAPDVPEHVAVTRAIALVGDLS